MRGELIESSRRVPIYAEKEVVVLGGGPAGIAAAAAAARMGCSTILVERYGFLGGMGTAAGVTNFCGFYANVYGEHRQVVFGLGQGLMERMARRGGLNRPHRSPGGRNLAQAYDPSVYKIAADDLVLSSGAEILFHALGAGVVMERDSTVDALLVETKSGRLAVRGRVFVDCSGDADLAVWCGVPYEKGRNAGELLYPTTMFRVNGVDPERAGGAWESIPALMEQAEQTGRRFPRKGPIVRPQRHPMEWRVNFTQIRNPDGSPIDGTDVRQLSYAEVEGRRQVWEIFEFLREWVPGFERSYIVDIPPQVGIRETRRVVGEYQLTEEDILYCAEFPDAVGVNGWPVEDHLMGTVEIRWPPEGSRGFNQLPYRMLIPKAVDNLLVAGRCASMTHGGQSAARVTGPCFAMGEAAGTAAALALRRGLRPRDVPVAQPQRQLEANGAFLGYGTPPGLVPDWTD